MHEMVQLTFGIEAEEVSENSFAKMFYAEEYYCQRKQSLTYLHRLFFL